MPVFLDINQDGIVFPGNSATAPTPVLVARANASEEAAALPNGKRALTPIIAASISGGCIAIAWTIALIHILVKRYRRRRRNKQLGEWVGGYLKSSKQAEEHKKKQFIVPPDPAVLEGGHTPGERIVLEKRRWWKARAKRMKGSSSEDWNMGSANYLNRSDWEYMDDSANIPIDANVGAGRSKGNGKGKERARPTSLRRYRTTSTSGSRRHSFGGPSARFSRHASIPDEDEDENEELETLELKPHPYHRLSAIISAADSRKSLSKSVDSRHATPSLPTKEGPRTSEEDTHTGLVSPDGDDRSLIGRDGGRTHKYPPSTSKLRQ